MSISEYFAFATEFVLLLTCVSSNRQGKQHTVEELLDLEFTGSLEGFEFEPENCKRAFEHYDKDKSGYLDRKELMRLSEVAE
jgi:Ca2+-binding EF-hand superfamily protein